MDSHDQTWISIPLVILESSDGYYATISDWDDIQWDTSIHKDILENIKSGYYIITSDDISFKYVYLTDIINSNEYKQLYK